MASLVESGMKNLHFGDGDSVGFFQMRVGIWNKGDYAGYPDKPELQVKWFLDQAEAVKKQRIAAGKSIDDPNQFGDWIADVERPAEQYRGRYQLRLDEANGPARQAGSAPPAAPPPPRPRPLRRAGGCRRRGPPEPKPGDSASSWPRPPRRRAREGRLGCSCRPAAGGPAERGRAAASCRAWSTPPPRRRRLGASTLGASALRVAQTQLGVHERASTPARGRQVPRRGGRRRPATRGARAS